MWRGRLLLVAVLCSAVGYARGQGLTVTIDVDYTRPLDFVGGPNDYRASSSVTLTCQAEGETGSEMYEWNSTCTGNCLIRTETFQNQVVGRTTLISPDSGTHTCTVTSGGLTGSDTVEVNVVGAGIFVNFGDGSVPTGTLPNNGILITRPGGSFTAMCRSESTMINVGQFVGLDGNTHNIGEDFGAINVRTNGQPGTVIVDNLDGTVFTAAHNGVYSCRIPDESGTIVDVNIGIYVNGFNTPPNVSSLTYDPVTQTLTCTSTDSPATTVTWTKDGATLIVDGDPRAVNGTTYNVTQTVTDRRASTYENVLTLPATGDISGTYSCLVGNALGNSNTETVEGTPEISEDPVFTLTSEDPVEFTLTCISTGGPATTVTWTTPMGNDDTSVTLLQNAVSATYTHTLTVAGRVPGEYICSVSNNRGTATRPITVQEAVPPSDLVFNQVNATTIRVSWTAPTSGAPPTGYRVFYLIDGDEGTEDVNDTEWLRGGFVSDRSSNITVSVITLSDYLPSAMADVANPDAGSVELEVKTSLTSIEVTWVELPVLSNGIITMYEIQYGPTNNTSNETIENGPPFRLTNLNSEMSFTFRVTPFTLFDRGDTSEITADTLPPQVQNVSVTVIDSTSVRVSWSSVSLLSSDVEDYEVSYKVYYSRVQCRKRQGPEEQSVTTNGTSVVIMRLTPGAQYQFQVVTLAERSGEIIEGQRPQIDPCSMTVLPGGGEADDGGTDSCGSIVGAIMGTFVITVLLYTVILVAVIGVVVVVKRKKMTYAVRTKEQQQETTMTECLAYGDVSTGERSGEVSPVYDYADAGMRVHTEQSGGEGIYDN